MKLTIIRLEMTEIVTRGVMLVDGSCKFVTLELPWRNNERNISCIPSGNYGLVPHSGAKYKDTFRVESVPDRGDIICPHIGNAASDTQGCVLLGMQFSDFGIAPAVSYSSRAMGNFRLLTAREDELSLEILEL